MATRKQVILVDGSSFLFRAYHATRVPLTTADGEPTQAVFGTINMLRRLKMDLMPTHLAMIMDAKGKTFRSEIYSQYKANRPPMPDDLRGQQEYVKQIVTALGITLISTPGVEADDVIGTLARQASQQDFDTLIVSSDKDMTQLIDDRVKMLDTMKKLRIDASEVQKKFGVPPEQIVEFLALMGDVSDNIPGVPSVGPKTAAKWLTEFGSLAQIVRRADEIKGKVGESLRKNLQQLEISKQLATIKCDVKLDVGIKDLLLQPPDTKKLRAIYHQLEFRSWLKELDAAQAHDQGYDQGYDQAHDQAHDQGYDQAHDQGYDHGKIPDETCSESKYETILDIDTLDRWIKKIEQSAVFAIDIESTSIDAHQAELVGISFSTAPGEAAYLPISHRYAGAPAQISLAQVKIKLQSILESLIPAKTGQNLKYDLEVLRHHGMDIKGITHDTMLMSYLLEAGNFRHDLVTLALKHLGHNMILFSDVVGSGKNQLTFDQVDIVQATNYAAEDADIALQLHHVLVSQVEKIPTLLKLLTEIEIPLIDVLARIETHGVKIDVNKLQKQSATIASRLVKIERDAHAVAGEVFNMASPKQIGEILYQKQGIPVLRKTPKGEPSTAEWVLQELSREHELPRLILEYRGLAKLKNTYTDKLPELVNPKSGRIHTSFHQAVVATGRLSSSDPNLQNIPIRTAEGRRIREAFIAEPGNVLIAADYSQIELRIMAHFSGDAGLIKAFEQGLDVHTATASEIFGVDAGNVDDEQRRRAKAINFGLIYGMSAFGLARQLRITQKQAREYINIYFDRYPGVKQYMDETKQKAREYGYVETMYGRKLRLPEIKSKNAAQRQYAERAAINAPMQGSAADLIKDAMLAVDRWIIDNDSSAKIIMQVHDELVLEVAEKEAEQVVEATVACMTDVVTLRVPLIVDTGIGYNWKEAH